MIICKPEKWYSSTYILDRDGEIGVVKVGSLRNIGFIAIDGRRYEVEKGGLLSAVWKLCLGGEQLLTAERKALKTYVQVTDGTNEFVLKRSSLLGSGFIVSTNKKSILTIKRIGVFSNKWQIESESEDVDFLTSCFFFWLAVRILKTDSGS